jgi:hypothetical protein
MKKVIVLFMLLFTMQVFADTVTWVPPTEREDGMALDPSEIAGYNIYNAAGTKINQTPIAGTSYDVDRIRTGPQVLTVRTLDTDGRESVDSLETATIPQLELAPPKAPSMFERIIAAILEFFSRMFA